MMSRHPRGNETSESTKDPLKLTLQIDAEHIPPKKTSWKLLYSGGLRMSVSSAAEASLTDVSSWITFNGTHRAVSDAGARGTDKLSHAYLPIHPMHPLQLRDIERPALPHELDTARAGADVVERDEHHVRQVHARQLDVQHARRRLDLRLQTVRGAAEHHDASRELADELVPLEDRGDVTSDLQYNVVSTER